MKENAATYRYRTPHTVVSVPSDNCWRRLSNCSFKFSVSESLVLDCQTFQVSVDVISSSRLSHRQLIRCFLNSYTNTLISNTSSTIIRSARRTPHHQSIQFEASVSVHLLIAIRFVHLESSVRNENILSKSKVDDSISRFMSIKHWADIGDKTSSGREWTDS